MAIKNTSDLRQMLLECIDQVRNGTMEPRAAHAVGKLAQTALSSAKLDLDVLKFNSTAGEAVKAGEKVLQLVNG